MNSLAHTTTFLYMLKADFCIVRNPTEFPRKIFIAISQFHSSHQAREVEADYE